MVCNAFGVNPKPLWCNLRNAQRAIIPNKIKYIHWSIFPNDTDYFHPSNKPFILNYRVQNMEQLIKNLQQRGVEFIDSMVSYPYGKFIHILDPEGNAIELWEPREDFFDTMRIPTNK